MISPDFPGRNKFRYTYNTDRMQFLRSGQAREPSPKGQISTATRVWDVHSILKTHRHCRSPRDYNVPEFFNPFCQYSYNELVKVSTNLLYTPGRFERWVVEPMVNMRYVRIPFDTEGHLCHYYKQQTMWLNPCHFANKGCHEGYCRFAHSNRNSMWQNECSANGVTTFPTKPEH